MSFSNKQYLKKSTKSVYVCISHFSVIMKSLMGATYSILKMAEKEWHNIIYNLMIH